MATAISTPTVRPKFRFDADFRHRMRLRLSWLAMIVLLAWVAVNGFSYYRLDTAARFYSPLHPIYRPSGTVGLRLGILGLALFVWLFLYAIRKRSKWLSGIGKTKHWLDFHVLCGIGAPVLITFHSSFKVGGLAGLAYWIMIAVALSGFIGRYIYAQVPRSLNAAELSLKEMQGLSSDLAAQLEQQAVLTREEIAPLLALPSPEQVEHLPMLAALFLMLRLDLARPLRVSRLRWKLLTPRWRVLTFGGFLPSRRRDIESVISAIKRQSWLSTKMLFLKRVHQLFHLWHVIHRPFSYSFAALIVIHITIAVLMGYY